MSGLIDIQRLRRDAQAGVEFLPSWGDYAPHPDDVLALVDAVEAARDVVHNAPFLVTGEQLERWWAAERRFDFGEGA